MGEAAGTSVRAGNEGASRPSRRLIVWSLAAWAMLAFIIPLAALTINAVKIAGMPLGVWMTAHGVPVALAALAIVFAIKAKGTPSEDGLRPPLIFAAEIIGSAGLLGFTGAIAALGYDGLALPLGLIAGLSLLAIAIAPRFVLYPGQSLGDFMQTRYGGVWPRRLVLVVSFAACALLLAADVRGGALLIQGLIGLDYPIAVATMTVALATAWIATSFLVRRASLGLAYLALLIGFGAVLAALAIRAGQTPLAYVSYIPAMSDLATAEQQLVADKLSDIKSLRPIASPFLKLTMLNFAGLVLAMALGVAAFPHLLARHVSRSACEPGDAARRTATATAFVTVFVLGLIAFAVFARLGVASVIGGGVENASLPPRLLEAHNLGFVDLCGRSTAGGTAPSLAADIANACAKVSGQRGFLRMQDVSFSSDSFVLVAPMIAGVPLVALIVFWASGLLAALVAGQAIVSGVAPSLVGGGALLIAASMIAALGGIEIPSLVADAAAIIASTLFAPLLFGLYWRRMTATGAVAAMLAGALVCGGYIAGVRLSPVGFYEVFAPMSDAAPAAVRKFELLRNAVGLAETDEARSAATSALTGHAAAIANWLGLRPAAIALLTVPLAFAVAIAGSLLTKRQSA